MFHLNFSLQQFVKRYSDCAAVSGQTAGCIGVILENYDLHFGCQTAEYVTSKELLLCLTGYY